MNIIYVYVLIMIFIGPNSAWAADMGCFKNNFEKYITAAEDMHKFKLEQLNNQTKPVQRAVRGQVDWQLSNLDLSKSVFSALLKNNPELIDKNVPIANLYQVYLSGYASDGCTVEKCNVDSGKLNGKADQALIDDRDFQLALEHNNNLTRLRMNRSKEERQADQDHKRIFYTPEFIKQWLSSKDLKIAGEIGNKSFKELGCL